MGESVDRRSVGSAMSVVFRPQSQQVGQLSLERRRLGQRFYGELLGDLKCVLLDVVEQIKPLTGRAVGRRHGRGTETVSGLFFGADCAGLGNRT
jgi:hypothetical protein